MAATNASGATLATPIPAFVMTAPVNASAPPYVPENSPIPVPIILSRPAANNCTSVAVDVPFALGGTAVAGVHYTLSTASPAQIPAGAASVTLALRPLADWNSHDARTVTFTLQPSPSCLAPTNGQATISLTDAVMPSFPTNAFLGTVSQDSETAENWSLGVVPSPDHVILFSPEFAHSHLAWNPASTDTVAGWHQPYAFTDPTWRVLFFTTPASPLVIEGDCVLNGGYWVHNGPSATPAEAVAVDVRGNLTIGAGSQINAGNGVVNQANGAARGYYLAGPGYLPSSGAAGTGSSFGGEGATNAVTYGSVLNPLSHGSSGRGDNASFAGGGLIVLNVGGTTTVNGAILSHGFGYPGTGRGGSTGGSINLTTGRLQGNGTIAADGGRDVLYGSGSGGRIRIRLTDPGATFAGFTGSVTAYGNSGTPGSAAGTIALQTAADVSDAGTVIVDNQPFADATNAPSRAMCTHLPPTVQADPSLAGTSWVLRNSASVRLTADTRIRSLSFESANARLFLEGRTLTVSTFSVNGAAMAPGTYRAGDLPAALRGPGAVVMLGPGTLLCIR